MALFMKCLAPKRFFWIVILLTAGLAACGNDRVVLPDEGLLYHDEFIAGHTGDWQVEGDELGRTAVLNEAMIIEIDAPNTLQFTTLAQPNFSDFNLEVDASQLAGDLRSSFGVLFRMQSESQFYRFAISGQGMYLLERHNPDGTRTSMLGDWQETAAIKQGLGVTNRLKVIASGPTIYFYVNDQLLQQVIDQQYSSGAIALSAGTFGNPGLRVAFDNLLVQEP